MSTSFLGSSAVAGDEISAVAGAVTVSVLVSSVSLALGTAGVFGGANAGGELDVDRTDGNDASAEFNRDTSTDFLPTLPTRNAMVRPMLCQCDLRRAPNELD